eukprot:3297381-Alexandrium_andersonii.AAC.1
MRATTDTALGRNREEVQFPPEGVGGGRGPSTADPKGGVPFSEAQNPPKPQTEVPVSRALRPLVFTTQGASTSAGRLAASSKFQAGDI